MLYPSFGYGFIDVVEYLLVNLLVLVGYADNLIQVAPGDAKPIRYFFGAVPFLLPGVFK